MRDVDRVLERMGDLMEAHIDDELLTFWRLALETGASLDELQAALQNYGARRRRDRENHLADLRAWLRVAPGNHCTR